MKEYIGKDGIPVREYELTDVHLLLESPQWFLDGNLEERFGTGEKTRRVIPAKVREAVQAEKERIYWAEVEKHLNYFTKTFKKRFQDSPDKDATIALEKKRWETVFDLETDLPMHLQDFYPQQIRKAWRQIAIEGESNCMDGTSLRHLRFHANASARFKFLQWLRDTPAEQILWDSTVKADFAIMWAENVRDIVRHFSTPESAEVQVFKRPNSQALELIEQDLAEMRATRDTEPPATPWRTMELIEHSSRGEATGAELAALLKAKLEASEDYYTQRRLAKALLTELEGLLTKHGNLLQNLGAQPMPIAIAQQWAEHLERIASETATGDPAQPERANTPLQGNEGGTGVEKELSYPNVAFILAYESIHVTTKAEALKHGAKYRSMDAKTADLMLLQECTPVYSSQDRLAPIQEENNGRQVKALKRRLVKIEPHLSDKAKPLFNSELQQVEKYLNRSNRHF